eukprot:1194676-Prorocentrum_minimum.AAC.5
MHLSCSLNGFTWGDNYVPPQVLSAATEFNGVKQGLDAGRDWVAQMTGDRSPGWLKVSRTRLAGGIRDTRKQGQSSRRQSGSPWRQVGLDTDIWRPCRIGGSFVVRLRALTRAREPNALGIPNLSVSPREWWIGYSQPQSNSWRTSGADLPSSE